MKPEYLNIQKLYPFSVKCRWKAEELYLEEVKFASNRFNKEDENIKGQVASVTTNFMKNLKSQVNPQKHNYNKIRKVNLFADGKVEIKLVIIAPQSVNNGNEKPEKVYAGSSYVFNKAREIKNIEGASAKSLGLAASQVVKADGFGDDALAIEKLSINLEKFGKAVRLTIKHFENPEYDDENISPFEALAYLI